jgi:hypothetical protein
MNNGWSNWIEIVVKLRGGHPGFRDEGALLTRADRREGFETISQWRGRRYSRRRRDAEFSGETNEPDVLGM